MELILKEALKEPVIIDFSSKSKFSEFSCIPGCQECCGYTYFLFSELTKLPDKLKEQLIFNEGKYEVITKDDRCAFYQASDDYFCSIHEYRPLRCRIYPYFPLIVDKRVIITLEPALKMKNTKNDKQRSCPGIGVEDRPLKQIIDNCLSFLEKLNEVPELLSTVILAGDKFNRIRNDRWFIDQSTN
jgi:Fe-S-cluster containining protein